MDGMHGVDGVSASGMGQPLISEDLKDSLEQLVNKVNRTLRPSSVNFSSVAPYDAGGDMPQQQQQFQAMPPQQQFIQQQMPLHHMQQSPQFAQSQPVIAVQVGQPPMQLRPLQMSASIPQTGPRDPGASSLQFSAVAPGATMIPVQPVQRMSSVVMSAGLASASPPAGSIMTPVIVGRQPELLGPAAVRPPTATPPVILPALDGSSAESKEVFKKCLQDLREENAALRSAQMGAQDEGAFNPRERTLEGGQPRAREMSPTRAVSVVLPVGVAASSIRMVPGMVPVGAVPAASRAPPPGSAISRT